MLACREQSNGSVLQPPEPADVEILSQEQQSEFEKVLKIRGNEKKFAALYRACGKPEPETYRACVCATIVFYRPLLYQPHPRPTFRHVAFRTVPLLASITLIVVSSM